MVKLLNLVGLSQFRKIYYKLNLIMRSIRGVLRIARLIRLIIRMIFELNLRKIRRIGFKFGLRLKRKE